MKFNKEFRDTIKDLLSNKDFIRLKEIYHHENSILHHSLKVAWLSYKVAIFLKLKRRDIIRGSLLHDFFLYDWRKERPSNGKLHAFEHPNEAYRNSIKYIGSLSKIEKDIILKHMWPLTIIPPIYLESYIVLIIDKLVASKELFIDLIKAFKKKK